MPVSKDIQRKFISLNLRTAEIVAIIPAIERFNSRVEKIPFSECHWWTGYLGASGYGKIVVNGKYVGAHRFAYENFVGPIPSGLFVCHKCDERSCVNPNHLFVGTQKENIDDMYNKGRDRKAEGEDHYRSKLTEKDIVRIRSLDGLASHRQIARLFGTGQQNISCIISRKYWKHVA